MSLPLDDTGDPLTRPNKRQQAETSYISPGLSEPAIMPPPRAPPKPDIIVIKTPRPDITMCLLNSVLIEQLKAHGLRELEASDFLTDLQLQGTLYSNPLQAHFPICFPTIVVEGKSYPTGKTIFEAQNQAAVSGACMTNLQHMLAELVELAKHNSPEPEAPPIPTEPLAFTICTEGPIIQLWTNSTSLIDDVRVHNMNIQQICHASFRPALREQVTEFFVAVDGVMKWASEEFLESIVKQLVFVWKAGRKHVM